VGRPLVTVSIASRHCNETLPRAVESVVDQLDGRVLVVVTSDGDADGPRRALGPLVAHPRVFLVELENSHGPYFAHDIALRATATPLFAVQDADDLSSPHRFSLLWQLLRSSGADAVFGVVRDLSLAGKARLCSPRPWRPGPLEHLVDHFGLFCRKALLAVGGYYGGARFGYDSFITALLAAFGRCMATPEVVYERHERAGSLTRAPSTGLHSTARAELAVLLNRRYQSLLKDACLPGSLREQHVTFEERADIDRISAELGRRMLVTLRALERGTAEGTCSGTWR
jgi:hypothetical protein